MKTLKLLNFVIPKRSAKSEAFLGEFRVQGSGFAGGTIFIGGKFPR
jgi:hypothetical protein